MIEEIIKFENDYKLVTDVYKLRNFNQNFMILSIIINHSNIMMIKFNLHSLVFSFFKSE
jgi:hypothetical protein